MDSPTEAPNGSLLEMAGKLEGIHGASVHSGSWGGEERGGAVPLILFSASLERQVETLGTNMGHELSRGRPASPASPAHISKAKPTVIEMGGRMPRWSLLGELGPITTLTATVGTIKNQLTDPGWTASFQVSRGGSGHMFPEGSKDTVMDLLVWPFACLGNCGTTPAFKLCPLPASSKDHWDACFLTCVVYRCGGTFLSA